MIGNGRPGQAYNDEIEWLTRAVARELDQDCTGDAGMDHVVIERTYSYSVELLWEALTDPESLAEWLMPGDFRPVVGHKEATDVGNQDGSEAIGGGSWANFDQLGILKQIGAIP